MNSGRIEKIFRSLIARKPLRLWYNSARPSGSSSGVCWTFPEFSSRSERHMETLLAVCVALRRDDTKGGNSDCPSRVPRFLVNIYQLA